MLIDIDPNKELPEYKLTLHKLTGEPLQELYNITNLQYKAFFVGIDELSFDIPYYRDDLGEKVENEIYSLVDGDYLIFVESINKDGKFFTITNVTESSGTKGETIKKVKALSNEYELGRKKLVNYQADSRMLYTKNNRVDDDGLEIGIMNYILKHLTVGWEIGEVDADVLVRNEKNVYRALNFANTNLLQVFKTLQEVFNCIFEFDTIERKINIYDFETKKGQNKGLYISDYNFIQKIDKTIDYDKIKTRLYLYGKDNISVQSISPTGQPYIDNFDVFKDEKYMTRELITALDEYEKKVENLNPNFEPLRKRLTKANKDLNDLINKDSDKLEEKGQVALNRSLTLAQSKIDVQVEAKALKQEEIRRVENSDSLALLHQELKEIQDKINEYQTDKAEIENLINENSNLIELAEEDVKAIQLEISNLQRATDPNDKSNFTKDLLKELDQFIRVETLHNAEYEEHSLEELLEEGHRELNRISQRPITFNIDSVDFLSMVECQHVWEQFILGDAVNINHSDLGFNEEVRLVGYTHQVSSAKLKLEFSNLNSIDDATLYLRDLLEDFKATATSVSFNKHKWDRTDNMDSKIASLVDSKLEDAKQDILKAVGQKHLFDDSGLWLYKEGSNGKIDPEQIRAINNTIALTDDNWKSVNTAITPKGIIAEHVYGKLGAFAQISTEQIEVGGYEGDESDKPVNNLQSTLDKQWDELRVHEKELGKTLKEGEKYNNIVINQKHGFVAGDGTGNTIVSMNATDGIKIQTRKNNVWKDSFFVDQEGNLNLSGNITLDGGHINWDEVNKPEIPPQYDRDNVLEDIDDILIEKTYIDANGIWTPGVYANTIDVTKGKIKTAQIEDLVVGGNVTMGAGSKIGWDNLPADLDSKTKLTEITKNTISTEYIKGLNLTVGNEILMGANAKISWDNVSDQPSIPTQYTDEDALNVWKESGYATNITKDGLYTGTITANKILIGGTNGSISFDDISGVPDIPELPHYILPTEIRNGIITSSTIKGNKIISQSDSHEIVMDGGVLETNAIVQGGNFPNVKDGVSLSNLGMSVYETGILRGRVNYDYGGMGPNQNASRMFIRSIGGSALKLEAQNANMSITANNIYMEGRVNFENATTTGLVLRFA